MRERMSSGGLRGLQILQSGVGSSEVGSIPTRSRQTSWHMSKVFLFVASCAVCVLLGGYCIASPVPQPSSGSRNTDSASAKNAQAAVPRGVVVGERPSTFFAPLRSAVFPGWGQMRNGRKLKAVVFFAVHNYLMGRTIAEHYWAEEAYRKMELLNNMGQGDRAEEYYNKYSDHFARREQYGWWWAAFTMLSMFDAYADAHLYGFDQEVEESSRVAVFPLVDGSGGRVTVGLGILF